MLSGDTIAAVASPHARSARGLIRVSGLGTRAVLGALAGERDLSRGIRAVMLKLTDSIRIPVNLAFFPGPSSYTGEDSAEIQCPGNPALIERILSRLIQTHGVRAAQGGEFTARAYLADRLTLEQAEGVAAIIAARNGAELAAAREVLGGASGARWRAWMEECATLLALVEAGIDFTDQEDVVAISPANLRAKLMVLARAIDVEIGPQRVAESGRTLSRVVLFGSPNAGKSTLFNRLLGRRRAVESPTAGTTRDALAETLDLSSDVPGAASVELVDIAGFDGPGTHAIGETQAATQETAVQSVREADVVLHCDPRGAFDTPAELGPRCAIIKVRTKADLNEITRVGPDVISVCAIDGCNIDTLRRAIAQAAWKAADTPAMLVPRHRRALLKSLEAMREALGAVGAQPRVTNPEIVAGSLRVATDALGELLGRISPDEVLGRIFASFCIGK